MPNANLCVLMGHVTAEPELRSLQNGTTLCEFCIAVHRHIKQDEEDVLFMPVTAWGKLGETCSRFLHKGSCAHVTGYLKQDNWQAQDGSKRSMIRLIADSVQFIGRRDDAAPASNGSGTGSQYGSGQRQQRGTGSQYGGHRYSAEDCRVDTAPAPQAASNTPAAPVPDDDIPF